MWVCYVPRSCICYTWHFLGKVPESLKYSNRFCFSMICCKATSPLWLVDLKKSLVVMSLYFSNPCCVKGKMLPCRVMDSDTWFISAWIHWNRGRSEWTTSPILLLFVKSSISVDVIWLGRLQSVPCKPRKSFHSCWILSTVESSRDGKSSEILIDQKTFSFSGPVKERHLSLLDVLPT